MNTIIMKFDNLCFPNNIFKKYLGKKVAIIETQKGILIKPIDKTIEKTRGILKGFPFTTEKFFALKKEEKELER